jgi:hypothetical protein
VCAVSLTLSAPSTAAAPQPTNPQELKDPRLEKLEKFFDHYKCPKQNYSNEYLSSADKYNLPYTLLPAISILESSCGKRSRLNNWWGWNSARTGFTSVSDGIRHVSERLSNGRYYKGKTLDQKINTYNPPSANPKYLKIIKGLIAQIEK